MNRILATASVALCLIVMPRFVVQAEEESKDSLLGVWGAVSMESEGMAAPAKAVEKMRFTFKADKLLIRGNFRDDREEECTYKLDPKQSPKHLDFTPPKETKSLLAIYQVKGEELKVCMRHGRSDKGRPTEFATKADTMLVLIVFKREKP